MAHLQTLKIKMVGNSGVGKSSIILRYCDNQYDGTLPPTIGIDFKFKKFVYKSIPIKLSLWDTAGQEKFRTVTSTYYKGAHGIVFVYDVSNVSSFHDLSKWVDEADAYVNSKTVVKMLVANKIDLQKERKVKKEESELIARKYGMLHCECSAKTTEGIESAFTLLTGKILESNGLLHESPIRLNNKVRKQESWCC
jgi:Ras-related protein Rab-18